MSKRSRKIYQQRIIMSDPRPPLVIAFTGWNTAPWLARFRAAGKGRAIIALEDVGQPLPERWYLCCWKPDPAVLRRKPAPLLIASPGAGVDHILKANPPAHIPVTRIVDPDLTGRMVEYVVMGALYHLRQMTAYAGLQRDHRWKPLHQPAAREVTVGLMGVGALGQACAAGLKAVGFTVIGWGRTERQGLGFPAFHGNDGLEAFLAETDILVSLLPSTPETRGLINADLLARLRNPGPLGAPALINAGRGDTVNEADLLAALRSGVLRAASLDVFVTEPLPADSPFWDLPNVVITPHSAADSMPDSVVDAVLMEIDRFEAGLPPLNPVDRGRGY